MRESRWIVTLEDDANSYKEVRMMKKLVLSTALILIAGLCFAQDDEIVETVQKKAGTTVGLEVTLGFPIHQVHSPSPHDAFGSDTSSTNEDVTTTTATAIGMALLVDFGKRVGLALDMDFSVGSENFTSSGIDSSSNLSSSQSLFGANVLFGPVIFLHKSNSLTVPLAIGVSAYYRSFNQWTPLFEGNGTWVKTSDIQVGPGFYLGVNYHFNEIIYIFTRVNVAIDIYRLHKEIKKASSSDHNEVSFGWGVKPTLGAGITFSKKNKAAPTSYSRALNR